MPGGAEAERLRAIHAENNPKYVEMFLARLQLPSSGQGRGPLQYPVVHGGAQPSGVPGLIYNLFVLPDRYQNFIIGPDIAVITATIERKYRVPACPTLYQPRRLLKRSPDAR